MKRKLCTNCKKKESCTRLCKGAKRYVNQDYVSRENLTESDVRSKIPNFSIENLEYDFSQMQAEKGAKTMTNREVMVSILLRCGFPAKNINKVLKLRAQSFRNLVRNVKRKMYK
jgi:DNA-binding NarL/FixJ family response regulator